MKKLINIIFLFLLVSFAYSNESGISQFDADDFFGNPFVNREFPGWFDDYDLLKQYFKNYSFEEKSIENKYTKEMDKEITIKNDNEEFVYYLRSYDECIFKKYTFIYNFSDVKYGFNNNMMLFDIVEICGEDYFIENFDKNIDVYFNISTKNHDGAIHFLLDKDSKKLKTIALIPEM